MSRNKRKPPMSRYPKPVPYITPIRKGTMITDETGTGAFAKLLYGILSMRRPAFSRAENKTIRKYIDIYNPKIDAFGNRTLYVPNKDGTPSKTLFSCHTDTVHSTQGKQDIFLDNIAREIFVTNGDCLGADDGTGMAILLTMFKHRVPGAYVFHRAEEIGCQGAHFIEKNRPEWLQQFDRAIAFDRKGTTDVIIAQSPGIIASESFGNALAADLNEGTGFKFANSKFGSVTDTAHYHKHIPECINLSVGYNAQHTGRETQKTDFLEVFVPKLISLDWEALPTIRTAGPATSKYPANDYQPRGYSGYDYGYGSGAYEDDWWLNAQPREPREHRAKGTMYTLLSSAELINLVNTAPTIAVRILTELKATHGDLWYAYAEVDTNWQP